MIKNIVSLLAGVKNDSVSALDVRLRRLLLYARVSTIAMLNYYGEDGLSYRDIKDTLKLEDGSLGPNLLWLKERGYVVSKEEVGEKVVVVYYITEEGRKAYADFKAWLENLLHLD